MKPEDYKKLRDKYKPISIKKIFLLESPPESGLYFYDPEGRTTEPLFSAMMKYVLLYEPENKHNGLEVFKNRGYFLVDAIYEPINKIKNKSLRNKMIVNNYPKLVEDLNTIIEIKEVDIILVKANIHRNLVELLIKDGFRIKNMREAIPFPSHGNQGKFGKLIGKYLR